MRLKRHAFLASSSLGRRHRPQGHYLSHCEGAYRFLQQSHASKCALESERDKKSLARIEKNVCSGNMSLSCEGCRPMTTCVAYEECEPSREIRPSSAVHVKVHDAEHALHFRNIAGALSKAK